MARLRPWTQMDIRERSSQSPLGCWEWQGYRTKAGYGLADIVGGSTTAHRVSYELFREPIPEGMEIDHLCRNRGCVNPDHLEVVTHAENMRRSHGWFGRMARATRCAKGLHEFTPENTITGERPGKRRCRACRDERMRSSRAA